MPDKIKKTNSFTTVTNIGERAIKNVLLFGESSSIIGRFYCKAMQLVPEKPAKYPYYWMPQPTPNNRHQCIEYAVGRLTEKSNDEYDICLIFLTSKELQIATKEVIKRLMTTSPSKKFVFIYQAMNSDMGLIMQEKGLKSIMKFYQHFMEIIKHQNLKNGTGKVSKFKYNENIYILPGYTLNGSNSCSDLYYAAVEFIITDVLNLED